jgi:hypothetical protein
MGNTQKSEIDVAVKHLTDTVNRATQYAVPLKGRDFKSKQIATPTRVLIQKRNWTQWRRTHDISFRPLIYTLKNSTIKEQLLNTWQKTLQG